MSDSHTTPTVPRVSDAQRTLEARVANPLLRRLLRSPLHWSASRWLVLVSYVGPKSGRRYVFPVAYATVDGSPVAVTPRTESNWWKNFRDPRACVLWHRGRRRAATGAVVAGAEADRLLGGYVDRHRLLARGLGVATAGGGSPVDADDAGLAVVRFTLG